VGISVSALAFAVEIVWEEGVKKSGNKSKTTFYVEALSTDFQLEREVGKKN